MGLQTTARPTAGLLIGICVLQTSNFYHQTFKELLETSVWVGKYKIFCKPPIFVPYVYFGRRSLTLCGPDVVKFSQNRYKC